jgi:hypothetical protein
MNVRRSIHATLLGALLTGCGSTTTSPGGSPAEGFEPPPDPNPVVRMRSSGLTPQVTHVESGVPIAFVNEDGVEHRIVSAPDLGYGECPEADEIGLLPPGETRHTTLRREVYCAFRSQSRPTDPAFQGLLVVD